MAGSIERIEQELATLNQAVASLAEDLHTAYSSYLTALGQAVRQQLILAAYHLCTQGYPDSFLKLSYSQRQQVQQTLRQLAHQVNEELLAQLHIPVVPDESAFDEITEIEEIVDKTDLDPLTAELLPDTITLAVPDSEAAASETPRSLTPADLAQWQQDLEEAIVQDLQMASHTANRLLQQAGVVPHRLPEPVLEAATKTEVADIASRTPNLLNLLVEASRDPADEAESDSAQRPPAVMHIMAIHLRLAEIEFTDPTVTAARSRIRSLAARLKTLGRDYRKKQRERAIAEAQAAWRASWFED